MIPLFLAPCIIFSFHICLYYYVQFFMQKKKQPVGCSK